MRDYALRLKAETTTTVVRLRVAFLSLLAISILLTLATQFLILSPTTAQIIWVVRAILLVICALMGPFIAWKDPAMTFKMLGGMFFIVMAFEAFDFIRAQLF